jgi:hypothetical protein
MPVVLGEVISQTFLGDEKKSIKQALYACTRALRTRA